MELLLSDCKLYIPKYSLGIKHTRGKPNEPKLVTFICEPILDSGPNLFEHNHHESYGSREHIPLSMFLCFGQCCLNPQGSRHLLRRSSCYIIIFTDSWRHIFPFVHKLLTNNKQAEALFFIHIRPNSCFFYFFKYFFPSFRLTSSCET